MGKRRTENANQPMSLTDLEIDFFIDDISTPLDLFDEPHVDLELTEPAR